MNTPRHWGFIAPGPVQLVHFEPLAGNRERALLGVIGVGEIGPCSETTSLFWWRLFLPNCASFGRAPTGKAAREHLTSRIEQWIEAADLKSVKA
jgi:hypothetical protein